VFICALNLNPLKTFLNKFAYGKSNLKDGNGAASGGTVESAIYSFFIPIFIENREFIAC